MISTADVHLGTRAFRLYFALAAVLIAVYGTQLSDVAIWATAAAYWVLTLLLIGLISRLASMIERCVREAIPEAGTGVLLPWARDEREPATTVAEERLAGLQNMIVRQRRFVSDAAHELRTPLTAQSLVGENVLANPVAADPELREAIVSMLEESKHMRRLIEGLLDLTRASLAATVDQEPRQPASLDLSALARGCVESLKVLAEEKHQTIEVNTAEVWVDADLTIVRQALLNVIHNSIEHCPEGTQIQVDTARCSPTEGMIRVQDDGPGIPPHEQHCVFERFYRGSGTSRQRSLGLGLSIAKAMLCSQGGGIELSSRPNTGCCFILTLPVPGACVGLTEPPGRDSEPRIPHYQPRNRNHWFMSRLARRYE